MPEAEVTLAIVARNLTTAEFTTVKQALAGLALQTETVNVPLQKLPANAKTAFDHFNSGEGSTRRLGMAMFVLSEHLTGLNPVLGRITEGLLIFGGGHGAVLVAAAALATIGGLVLLVTGHFTEHHKKLDELEKKYAAVAKEMAKAGDVLSDIQTLEEDVREKTEALADATANAVKQDDQLQGETGDLGVGMLDAAEAAGKLTKAQVTLNAAFAEAEKPALALERSLEDQVIGLQKGRDAAERFKLGIAGIDPELLRNIRDLQEYIETEKVHREVRLAAAQALVDETRARFHLYSEAIPAEELALVRLKSVQAGDTEQTTNQKVALEQLRLERERYIAVLKAQAEAEKKRTEEGTGGEGPGVEGTPEASALTFVTDEMLKQAGGIIPAIDAIKNKLTELNIKDQDVLARFAKAVGDDTGAWRLLAQEVANGIPVEDAVNKIVGQLALMKDVTAVLTAGFNALFQGIASGSGVSAKAFLQAMAQMAGAKATFEIGEGIAALAASIFPGIPSAGVSAAQHFKAAAIFGTLAIGLAAAASGAGGAGGGATGATAAYQNLSTQMQQQGTGTIIVEGGLLDMSDPRQADALANALYALTGRRVLIAPYGSTFGVP